MGKQIVQEESLKLKMPPTVCLEMLVELFLQESQVEKLWNGILVSTVHVFIIILFSLSVFVEFKKMY